MEKPTKVQTKVEVTYSGVSEGVSQRFDSPGCWFVCVCSSLASLIIAGILYSYGIFFPFILEEFNAGKATTALVGSLSLSSMGLFSPVSARLIDRFGCRVMMICGGLTCAVALFASSFSPNIYVLFVAYGLGVGVGGSFIYISAFQVIPLYFQRHRSFATAISSAGPGVGLLLMSPIIQTLLEDFNWRKALMILAAANLAPCILGSSVKRKSKPSLQSKQDSTKKEKQIGCCKCPSFTYNSALFKNQVFVLLCTSMAISCLALSIPAVHLAKYAEDLGVPGHRSSWMYVTMGVTSAVSRIFTGKLCDTGWISLLHIYQFGIALFGIADFALPFATGFEYLIVYCCLYGIGEGLMATPMHCTVLTSFPGEGFGWYMFFQSISWLIGPVLAGLIADLSGSYHPAFITAGALFFISFFLPFLHKYLKTEINTSDREQVKIMPCEIEAGFVVFEKVTVL